MKKNSKLETIKNLLELAKRSDNISEAESAMQKAQLLALKEGVDLKDVGEREEEKKKVVHWTIPQKTKSVPYWRIGLAMIIAENFRVKAYQSYTGFGKESVIKVVGNEDDVEIFKVMFDYAETCIEIFFKKYLSETKKSREMTRHDSLVLRNSYTEGFLVGIKEALERNVECYALSLSLPVEVETELNKIGLTVRKVRKTQVDRTDVGTYKRGLADGKEAGNRNKIESVG